MDWKRTVRNVALGGALIAGFSMAVPAPEAHAAVVFISAGIAPPAIPVYDQPLCPGDGYIWTPGYWAWDGAQYYWVEGAWVLPPYQEALWTPGWWGWGTGAYFWHPGYWGRTVGYYGGINYGFGYFGVGFYGGYWNSGRFFYNTAYGHFGPGFRGSVYNRSYAGFAGRPGGPSFNAHPAGFGAGGNAFNHGSPTEGRSGFAAGGQRGYAAQGFNGNQRGYAGQAYSGGQRGFAAPAAGGQRGYAAPAGGGGARGYSAPAGGGGGRGYSAPAARSAPSGGGSHGGGGAARGGGHR